MGAPPPPHTLGWALPHQSRIKKMLDSLISRRCFLKRDEVSHWTWNF